MLIASYALGFLNGAFQVSGSDRAWAKGDKVLADFGYVAASAALLARLFEGDAMLRLADKLPQLKGLGPPATFQPADLAGGADALAFMGGSAVPKGGQLAYLLRQNLTDEERSRASL